jgi:phage baseplate assembly protein V
MFYADAHAGRGMVRRVEVIEVDDSGDSQIVTMMGLADEIFKISMRHQAHGLTGVPRKGAIGSIFLAGGRPDQAFVINLEHPDDRIKGKDPGATTVYSSDGKNVEIRSPGGGEVHINPPG